MPTRSRGPLLLWCAFLSAWPGVMRAAAAAPAELSFNEHIQPILADACLACHGLDAGSRKAGLRLDRFEHATAQRPDGPPAIVPGRPDESPLIQRIESADPRKMMPPPEAHKTISPEHRALLRRWIAEGARYEEHWAFIAPRRPAVPAVAGTNHPIDAFIRSRLAREGIAPVPEADRRSLLRRAALDLTGLIPAPAEVEAFVADAAPGAYERAVDRLLASPRYGEHRARHWLDYVRYADTHGVHFDNYRAIWPYRDYVVRSFNANQRFDAFVREQLAGDLLPARTIDQLVATGLMRCNLTTNEGGTIPEEVFVNQTRDRVEAFGATFLGLSTGCAACHDHKFDPITTKDFYGLAAFLGNTAEKPWDLNIAEPAPVIRVPRPEQSAAAAFLLQARADVQERLQGRRAQARELTGAWLAAGNCPQPVSTEALEVRLRLDEGKGDVVRNAAPHPRTKEFKADTNPLIWGESSWFWSSMRMDIHTRLSLGAEGDVDAGDKFSTGGWILLRAKPGGGVRTGTGNGSLFARMGDEKRRGGAGWDVYQEGLQIYFALVPDVPPPSVEEAVDAPAPKAKAPSRRLVIPPPPVRSGLLVATRPGLITRDEWVHVFVTYDGSRRASGMRIFLNGRPAETEIRLDQLPAGVSIRTDAAMHVGRRDDYNPMRETRYQDFRFYRRALAVEEVQRLPFEDLAAEITAREPDPRRWTTDEAFVVADRFFLGEKDPEHRSLAALAAAHDAALEILTRDGDATLVAVEKTTPAYSDVLKRGDYFARGERVGPSVPHFLPALPAGAPVDRRGLAEWLLTAEHPLFARVAVNRMWQEVFGRGLVESSGEFGVMGDRPTHPELLDWLAVEFRESGWDVKRLYRLLVTSATYRQAVAAPAPVLARDPGNKWLGRGPRFRMDGEMLRDSALLSAGLLVERLGGPPVKPYQPPGIWEEVAMPESNTRTYVPSEGEGLYRRSLYTFWKRASPPASLETFDATSREVVCSRRARTNTPLQAFVTLNDPQWVEAARKLGERALGAAARSEERLRFLALATLARPLAPTEEKVLLDSLTRLQSLFAAQPEQAAALLKVGASPVGPGDWSATDRAVWTMAASQFLNLDEFLNK